MGLTSISNVLVTPIQVPTCINVTRTTKARVPTRDDAVAAAES